jgi:hypothetical protein
VDGGRGGLARGARQEAAEASGWAGGRVDLDDVYIDAAGATNTTSLLC